MSTSVIHPNVEIGEGSQIEDFCIIGKPAGSDAPGTLRTVIGPGAVIRSHSVIYAGNIIGSNFRTGHQVCIREENEIGNDVSIGTQSCVEHHVRIGNGVRIHSQAFIPEYSTIEDLAWLGPNVVLTNAKYPKGKNVKERLKGALIGRSAKVGANSTILPGVVVGKGSLVGAGAVVAKDVAEFAVVVGNPATQIGSVLNNPEYGE